MLLFFKVVMADTTEKYKRYDELFQRAVNAANPMKLYRLRCEEFAFNDVDGTLSQWNKKQKDTIKREYDIPISTKIAFPIIEQLTAMLTASAPFPRLTATTIELKEFVAAYEGAYAATWYECKGNTALKLAIQDALTVGSGYLHGRKASLLTETTFGVVLEHISWKNVWIDPDSKKADLSDARYVIIAELVTKEKAEEDYDINLTKEDMLNFNDFHSSIGDENQYLFPTSYTKEKEYVWLRRVYEYEVINLYATEEGQISLKKPKPRDIPNPEKEALRNEIQTKLDGTKETEAALVNVENQARPMPDAPMTQQDTAANAKEMASEGTDAMQDDMETIQAMTLQYDELPNTITIYDFILENGESIEVRSFERMKDKRVREVELVGRRIVSNAIVPSLDKLPVVHITFSHNRSPNLTYGLVHYMMDMIKALNKIFAMLLKDMQTNGNRKVLLAKGSVQSVVDFESKWSQPNAVNEYIPNPSMDDGGKPHVVEPSPMNQSYTYLIDKFQSLIEYTTGINSMTMGNPQGDQPTTYGVAQQMASFGTQRIKMYARTLEGPLEDFAEVIVAYLNAYGNRDKISHYFDANGELKTAQILDDGTTDIRFKVRVDVGSNLPTTRQMFAQMLSLLSSQTKNPQVADQLTKVLLENVDMPAADKLAKEIDQITQLTQQIEESKKQLKALEGENKSLKFNLEQTQVSAKVKEEAMKIIQEMRMNPDKAQEVLDTQIKTEGEAGNPLTNYLEQNQEQEQAPELQGGQPAEALPPQEQAPPIEEPIF